MTTLSEQLKHVKNGTIVKIGAGNGFIYAYYKNDLTLSRIEKASEQYFKWLNKSLARKEKDLENLPSRKQAYIKKEIKKLKRKTQKKKQDITAKAEELYKKKEKECARLIHSFKALISLFIPFQDRKVIKVYKSDEEYEPNTIIIAIKGKESGNYWNIDEYAQANGLFIKEKDKHKDFWKGENREKD